MATTPCVGAYFRIATNDEPEPPQLCQTFADFPIPAAEQGFQFGGGSVRKLPHRFQRRHHVAIKLPAGLHFPRRLVAGLRVAVPGQPREAGCWRQLVPVRLE